MYTVVHGRIEPSFPTTNPAFSVPQVDRWKTPRPPPYDSPLGLDLFQRGALAHTGLTLPSADYSGRVRSSPGDKYRLSIICVQDESGMSRQVCGEKNESKRGKLLFFFSSYDSKFFYTNYNLCEINYFFHSMNRIFVIYFYLFLDFRIGDFTLIRFNSLRDIFACSLSVGCITYPGSPCICDRYLCGTTCRRCYFLLTFTRPRVSGFQTGPRHPRANIATNI